VRGGRQWPRRGGARRPAHRRLIATRTVLVWLDRPEDYLAAAAETGLTASIEFVTAPLSAEPPDDLLARSEALLAWRPPARLAARAPRLRWAQSLTAGVEQWLASPDVPADLPLTCARGVHRVQMPENILAALFFVTKELGGIALDQRDGRWRRRVPDVLAGKTLGILGLGTIGAEVARKATALEMRVIGTRRSPAPVPHVERVVGPEATDAVLGESDHVLLLLPSTPETRGLVNRKTLGAMKPGAWLLNFARGDLVVDEDLVEAVRDRRIAGAVLDVFTREPLPAESPLWRTDGIVIFPHIGGLHPRRDRIVAGLWVENLQRWLDGRPLLHLVDRARGY
jgi:phosphoglycerate dehydrogenase-like enzyme